MPLSIGIVGLPNVGKSTLFNALSGASVLAANYPFATKDPNVGVVPVPDDRVEKLAALYKPKKPTHAALQFVDIAGLVRGASKGEGLGNQFLANIREVDAVAHVLRCFSDPDVMHVDGSIDPLRDKEVVDTELQLKDLESLEKKRERRLKDAKAPGKPGEEAKADLAVYDKVRAALEAGRPARSVPLGEEEKPRARELFLLTAKPVLYVANVDESQLAALDSDPLVAKVRALAQAEGARMVAICSKVEAEIQQLPEAERGEYLATVGLSEPGLNRLVREGFALLGLQSFFTGGEDGCRAWVIRKGTRAPQAAGAGHSDFERGVTEAGGVPRGRPPRHRPGGGGAGPGGVGGGGGPPGGAGDRKVARGAQFPPRAPRGRGRSRREARPQERTTFQLQVDAPRDPSAEGGDAVSDACPQPRLAARLHVEELAGRPRAHVGVGEEIEAPRPDRCEAAAPPTASSRDGPGRPESGGSVRPVTAC